MKKPIIGIIGRCFKEENQNTIEVNESYRLAIVKAGGIPIIIVPPNDLAYEDSLAGDCGMLNEEEVENLFTVLRLCDGFLMTGGTRWYHFDEVICRYAIEHNLPILGICLGMHILANMNHFCGTIDSDKTVKNDTVVNHHQVGVPYVHEVFILPGMLRKILKQKKVMVNSRHYYHATIQDWFQVEAISQDGIIEAISIPQHKFALGLQWHPEDMIFYDSIMLKIFEAFIKAAHSF